MPEDLVALAVEEFAAEMRDLADEKLDTEWKWGDYDEGVRFAFFRVYEELRTLAAALATERAEQGPALTTAQRALGQWHQAYRDLKAVLLGADLDLVDRPPAEGQWPLRRTVGHMMGADIGFWMLCDHAMSQHREGQPPTAPGDADWEKFMPGATGSDFDDFDRFLNEAPTLAAIMERWDGYHERIIRELGDITDAELALPAYYWESSSYPMEFRLHRFESHLRQHSIQVEKTLAALAGVPSEAQRLLRLIYAALGELEANLICVPDLGAARRAALADTVRGLMGEVKRALAQES